jgi:hypothetical protein
VFEMSPLAGILLAGDGAHVRTLKPLHKARNPRDRSTAILAGLVSTN